MPFSRTIGLAVAVLAALALSSCSSSSPTVSSVSGTPVSGGHLTVAIDQEPLCLDPHQTGQAVDGIVVRPVVDSLVYLDSAGKLHPWLAQSWTISADGLHYTFKVRSGVKFSDGTVFDAAAVKANLDQIVAPATKSLGAAIYLAPYYQSSTVVNSTTVTVNLKKPFASFLDILSTPDFGIESPASLAQGPAALCTKVVGSGPFVMEGSWQRGQGVSYQRNPAYNWAPEGIGHQGPAYLQSLTIRLVTQDAVRVGALTSGQVGAITAVPAVNVKSLKVSDQVWENSDPGENYSYFPNTNRAPFNDLRVREAFRDGVDWATLVNKLYFGAYKPAAGPLSPATVFAAPASDTATSYNPSLAAKLLDEAGWTSTNAQGYRTKDGKQLTVDWPLAESVESQDDITLAQQVQAEVKTLGIDLNITNQPVNQVIPTAEQGTYDILATGYSSVDANVLRTLFDSANNASPGVMGTNISRYTNPQVDQLLQAAEETTNDTQRAADYDQVQEVLVQQAAVFPVYVSTYTFAAQRSLHGVTFDSESVPSFYQAWLAG